MCRAPCVGPFEYGPSLTTLLHLRSGAVLHGTTPKLADTLWRDSAPAAVSSPSNSPKGGPIHCRHSLTPIPLYQCKARPHCRRICKACSSLPGALGSVQQCMAQPQRSLTYSPATLSSSSCSSPPRVTGSLLSLLSLMFNSRS